MQEQGTRAVSYTHLDVYKRQLYYTLLHNKYKKSAASKNKLSFRTLAGVNPVSYTHLDVYKRQT